MLPHFCKQTIIRIRPGTKTLRGSVIPDWEHALELEINGCSVQPAGTSLSQDGRIQGTTDGLTAYVPPGSDILEGDRIRYGGKVYTINGEPRVWPAAERCEHIMLNLMRWTG